MAGPATDATLPSTPTASKLVASTVTSVGPYRLTTRASVTRRTRSVSAAVSASPPENTARNERRVSGPSSAAASTKSESTEGTNCTTVTPRSATVRAM